MRILFPLFIFCIPLWAELTKIHFELAQEPIDVVIPCAPKDCGTLERCVQSVRDYGKNIRRIIVVSKDRFTDSAEWYDEANYPFTPQDLMTEVFSGDEVQAAWYVSLPEGRALWIYQQFLKLYAPFVIPEISSNVLIVDSDLMFLNPMEFMTEDGWPIFNTGWEHNKPYFVHAQLLLPDLHRVHQNYSGICNYMLFQKPILEDLFQLISDRHGIEPWKALCRCIDNNDLFACISEYEIYFNFTLLRTDQYRICPLNWRTVCDWENKEAYRRSGVSYLTCHRWMKGR